MNNILPKFPSVSDFIFELNEYGNTFLYDRLDTPNYGFWPHFEYFLSHIQRFGNSESIIERLSLIVPSNMEIKKAWEQWRKFRSAQSEITSIYLIENYLKGVVEEIIPTTIKPTADIKIRLRKDHYLVEVKAQSGQQDGSIHPRANGWNHFSPDDELDLKSWLFEEKLSSRDGKPMKPKVLEADCKGASILFAMVDIMFNHNDLHELVPDICPSIEHLETRRIDIPTLKPFTSHFYKAIFPVKKALLNLKEIWLFHESHLESFVVLSQESILLKHMRDER